MFLSVLFSLMERKSQVLVIDCDAAEAPLPKPPLRQRYSRIMMTCMVAGFNAALLITTCIYAAISAASGDALEHVWNDSGLAGIALGINGSSNTTNEVYDLIQSPGIMVSVKNESSNATYEVYDLIQSPSLMYQAFGMSNMPLLLMLSKGYFNFAVQTTLFVGRDFCKGRYARMHRLKAGHDELRFSRGSIAFQVANQLAVINAYTKLCIFAKPWLNGTTMTLFAYLITQHASSISLLVGFSYNYIIFAYVQDDDSVPYSERYVAIALMLSGFVIGLPLLASIAWVSMSWAMVLYLSGALIFGALILMTMDKYGLSSTGICDFFSRNTMDTWLERLIFLTAGMGVTWFVLGIDDPHAWMLGAATILEFFFPTIVIAFLFFNRLVAGDCFRVMFYAFVMALCAAYFVTMLLPAVIVTASPAVGLRRGGSVAFWGKKLAPYIEDTFMTPAYNGWKAASGASHSAARVMALWWSQFAAYIS